MFDTISNRSNTSSIFEGLLGSAPPSRSSASARNLEALSFSQEMAETQVAADAVAAPVANTDVPQATTQPVTENDQILPRQDSASGQKASPAAVTEPVQARTKATPAAETTPPVNNAPKTPIEILQDVMKAQGMDPGGYQMESFEEVVMYPGGSYLHRFTQVNLPNGYQEKFSTDLMSKFPEVTANELARIMKMGADGPVTGLV